ncbi:MAG: hypothetical protein JXQ93_02720 [Flavobacteriaceae bacterium]
MKKRYLLLLMITCLNCSDSGVVNNCFPNNFVDETISLDLPQFINLRVPGGWGYANGGLAGLVIFNQGNNFKAFDRRCPEQDQSSCASMIVENDIILKCTCDDNEYNYLNGSPLTSGATCFAREYRVQVISSTVIRITNF